MRRSLVILAAVALLGVLGVHTPVQAGTGSPNDCSGWEYGETRIPILTSPVPITLGIAIWNGEGAHPRYRLCYSTSPAGWGGNDTTGGSIEYGSNVYWPNARGDYSWVECSPQSNPSALAPSCYVGQDDHGGTTACATGLGSCAYVQNDSQLGHVAWDPVNDPTGVNDLTVSFSIPIALCYGACTSATPSLGPTGVVTGRVVEDGTDETEAQLNRIPTDRPAGTSTGGGFVIGAMSYCVNGSCTSLTPATYAGAGTDASAGPTTLLESGSGILTCFSPVCVPGAVAAHIGATVAAVQVGSTMIPVNSPVGAVDACVYSWEVVYETVLGVEWQVDSPCD